MPVLLPNAHDVRTVNEIFCRADYGRGSPRVVVDVGPNIGISALYFLTRRADSVLYAWAPVPANIATLQRNLASFPGRWHLEPQALAPQAGRATFLTEPVRRYGGLPDYLNPRPGHTPITVEYSSVVAALDDVLDQEGTIDLVKIDTEGSEDALVDAIPPRIWAKIGALAYEDFSGHVVWRHGDA